MAKTITKQAPKSTMTASEREAARKAKSAKPEAKKTEAAPAKAKGSKVQTFLAAVLKLVTRPEGATRVELEQASGVPHGWKRRLEKMIGPAAGMTLQIVKRDEGRAVGYRLAK